jgi:hypothetical protein
MSLIKTVLVVLLLSLAAPLLADQTHVKKEITRSVSPDGRYETELLQGKAALAHLERLKAENPRIFERAAEVLTRRGYRRTDIVAVRRVVDRHARGPRAEGVRPAQNYSENSSQGEIVFWSWDDEIGRAHV